MTKIEPRIEKLFTCLAAAKHLKFTAAYPTEGAVNVAKIVWQNGLKELSDAEIASGIKAIADWLPVNSEDRLPTVSEFKNLLCRRIPRERPLLNVSCKDFKPASHETARENWQALLERTHNTRMRSSLIKILQRYE
jgi:hypothetical protein